MIGRPMSTSRIALIGVCGGVAAFKAVEVVSRLRRAGWDVQVTLSEAAAAEGLSLEAYLRRRASTEPTPEGWAERGARAREILKAWNGYDPTPEEEAKLDEHLMHEEWCSIDEGVVQRLEKARASGGRIVAVGTTAVRTLETASRGGRLAPFSGTTELFIRPPYVFRSVDALLTNFHLPKSTLLILVRTFGGDELIRRAYAEAIREHYRFFSYGDAMLIV